MNSTYSEILEIIQTMSGIYKFTSSEELALLYVFAAHTTRELCCLVQLSVLVSITSNLWNRSVYILKPAKQQKIHSITILVHPFIQT